MAETLPPAAVTGPTFLLESVGFGGEAGGLAELAAVAALQSTQREPVRTDSVDTRQRSGYRLCRTVRDAMVAMISQDGGLQHVRWH